MFRLHSLTGNWHFLCSAYVQKMNWSKIYFPHKTQNRNKYTDSQITGQNTMNTIIFLLLYTVLQKFKINFLNSASVLSVQTCKHNNFNNLFEHVMKIQHSIDNNNNMDLLLAIYPLWMVLLYLIIRHR